jgi:hypothetical protein
MNDMLTLLMHSRTDWYDFFGGTPTYSYSSTYGTQLPLSGSSAYVSNSLFRSISSSSDGGALYSTNSVTYLFIESTSFFSCKTSGSNGGAIYFYDSSGRCALHEVCGYDCNSTSTGTSYGHFLYTQVYNSASSNNYISYSSIVGCVSTHTSSYYILRHYYGNLFCPSVNISMNECQYHSIYYYPLSDSNSITCSLSYSSITDNHANGHTCLYLWSSYANFRIKSCNILRNTQGSPSSTGTFYTCGSLVITDSCILGNNASNIVYTYYSNYPTTILNCTIDKTTNNGYLTIKNTVTKSFIHALNHISTQYCLSEYDSVGTLTPPSPNKQINCFTYGNSFCHSKLRDFISLIFVLNFIFIHLDTSTYYLY